MDRHPFAAIVAVVCTAASWGSLPAATRQTPAPTRETPVAVGGASLYVREVGRGRPLIVLHGGPDFDHAYLRPEPSAIRHWCPIWC